MIRLILTIARRKIDITGAVVFLLCRDLSERRRFLIIQITKRIIEKLETSEYWIPMTMKVIMKKNIVINRFMKTFEVIMKKLIQKVVIE